MLENLEFAAWSTPKTVPFCLSKMDFFVGVNDIPLGIEDEASIESARPIMHSGARHDDAAEAVN